MGGMLAFLVAAPAQAPSTRHRRPVTSRVTFTAARHPGRHRHEVDTGNNPVTAAEYFIDTTGAGGGTPMSGTCSVRPAAVTALVTAPARCRAATSLYVRGRDAPGQLGSRSARCSSTAVTRPAPPRRQPPWTARPDQQGGRLHRRRARDGRRHRVPGGSAISARRVLPHRHAGDQRQPRRRRAHDGERRRAHGQPRRRDPHVRTDPHGRHAHGVDPRSGRRRQLGARSRPPDADRWGPDRLRLRA